MKNHWSQHIKEVIASINVDVAFATLFAGGAENGQFWWISDVRKEHVSYRNGKFERGDILLEINGEKVCGYIAEDLILWTKQVTQNAGSVVCKVVRGGFLTKDLRQYLSTRFQKASVDHDLQQTIRNNLFRHTIPCTTRAARPGEVNGVDYTFLSVDEFLALEDSGKLLESGCYEGNYYGTPLPASQHLKVNNNVIIVNGREDYNHNETPFNGEVPVPLPGRDVTEDSSNIDAINDHNALLENDSAAYHSIYYTANGIEGDELPYGWERVEDPRYGVYFIDHIHKKTQYERPSEQRESVFTKDPGEMRGDFVKTTLVKGAHGLGFTIVGDDFPDTAFLQLKDVVPLGPAYNDGALQPGDVLVYVNGVCVLGYAHQDILRMFQSMPIGEPVVLEVCRGYPPLLYDPHNSSDVEAAAKPDISSRGQFRIVGNNNLPSPLQPYFQPMTSPPSSPNKNAVTLVPNVDDSAIHWKIGGETPHPPMPATAAAAGIVDLVPAPQFLRISIAKGTQGFGFTIADSMYGQRVRQVIDGQRCKSLAEGDLLLEVNRVGVKDMPHQQVVQLLKNCLPDREVSFLVQRGGIPPPSRTSKSPAVNFNGNNALIEVQQQDLVRSLTEPVITIAEQPKTPSVEDDSLPASRYSKVVVSRSSARAPADFSPERLGRSSQKRVTMSPPVSVDQQQPVVMKLKAENIARLNRSRTPGPDFLRSMSAEDRNFDEIKRKTRSKTPTPQRQSAAVTTSNKATTPNFVPASDYPTIEKPSPHATASVNGASAPIGPERMAPGRLLPLTPTHRISNTTSSNSNGNNNDPFSQPTRSSIIAGFAVERDGMAGNAPNRSHPVDRRRLAELPSYMPPTSVVLRAGDRGSYDVTLVRRVDEGFGFVIASSPTQAETTIGRIIEGTPAQRSGRLAVGDRIVAVNGTPLHQMNYDSVISVIQQSGYSIVLTITRDERSSGGGSGVGSPAAAATRPVDLRWKPANNNGRRSEGRPISRQLPAVPRSAAHLSPSTDGVKLPNNLRTLLDTEKVYTVDLTRGARGFGFSIRGGREFGNMPLFVLSIAEGGPADIDGRLKVGDQILEISGRITENASHAEAIDLIQNGGPMIRVVAKRTSLTVPQSYP